MLQLPGTHLIRTMAKATFLRLALKKPSKQSRFPSPSPPLLAMQIVRSQRAVSMFILSAAMDDHQSKPFCTLRPFSLLCASKLGGIGGGESSFGIEK